MRFLVLALLLSWQLAIKPAYSIPVAPSHQLKQAFRQAQQDTTRLRLCVALCRYYFIQSQFDSMYLYIRRGMPLLARTPSHLYSIDLQYYLANYYRHIRLFSKGIQVVKAALSEARQANNSRRVVDCQYVLAMLYSDDSQLANAANQIAENLKFLRHVDNKPALSANYLLIIELFASLNNKPMQTLSINRYIALANSISSIDDQMYAYAIKAKLLEEQNRFEEAGALFRTSLHYAYLTRNPACIVDILNSQSVNFRNCRQFKASIKTLNKAFTLAKSYQLTAPMAETKRELAVTYLASRQFKQALQEASYALRLSRQNKTVTGITASLECLGKVLEANGNYQKALELYKEQQQLKEQKFTENNVKQIAQMQAQFETENKDQTIKILQKNAQIDQLKVVRQQQELSISKQTQLNNAIIICLLLILVGVIFYFLFKSRQNYLQLQETTHELVEANTVKDKLFSIISHDLRSPLALMKTTLYQGRQSNELPSTPFTNRLDRQVDTVLDLLANLLDWSVIQFKGVELIQEPLLLQDTINETVSQASDLIEQKQLGLINQLDKTHVVLANKHQLRAVIRNLLNNAVKFTPVDGYIRLHSAQKDDFIELTIRDSGIGMSSEQLASLFIKPEVRTGTAGEAGTGLGLRISKELVERLGGTLRVDSWPQKGTLVRVQLKSVPSQVLS